MKSDKSLRPYIPEPVILLKTIGLSFSFSIRRMCRPFGPNSINQSDDLYCLHVKYGRMDL